MRTPSKTPAILVAALLLVGAGRSPCLAGGVTDYRAEMKGFVASIATRARLVVPSFGVFPQNGADLGDDPAYLATITGIGQEDLHYGYNQDAVPTPAGVTAALEIALDRFAAAGKLVLTVDYPFTRASMPTFDEESVRRVRRSYRRSRAKGYVPYATVRSLSRLVINPVTEIPPGAGDGWDRVRDWGYRLQPSRNQTRRQFLTALRSSPFDLIVIDYSLEGDDATRFTPEQIASLKRDGRKVVAYLSIGEAESYRWYWQEAWEADHDGVPDAGAPAWLLAVNPDWPGNYKVKYWDPAWQSIIFGYLDIILGQGFDGVYLDIIDAYEYFENP